MKLQLFTLTLSLMASSTLAAKAPKNKDSPSGAVARADFDDDKLHGIIEFSTAKNKSVEVHVDITGLPETGGPFYYHIHKKPLKSGASCESTSTHFNPYNAPADCLKTKDDSYCQVGDLSGKHGYINTTCFEDSYYDPYISLNPKNKAYPVGLAINLHYANQERFACANIELVDKKVKREFDDVEAEFVGQIPESDNVVSAESVKEDTKVKSLKKDGSSTSKPHVSKVSSEKNVTNGTSPLLSKGKYYTNSTSKYGNFTNGTSYSTDDDYDDDKTIEVSSSYANAAGYLLNGNTVYGATLAAIISYLV
ncbi:hypothetical protein LJB42_000344 [Komagataella kurtzmanii]|nr:hypothetical protein LJB42_000344 [Komagataella kurtzmanii]